MPWWKEGYLSSNGRCSTSETPCGSSEPLSETHDPLAGSTDPQSAAMDRLCGSRRFQCTIPDLESAIHYAAEVLVPRMAPRMRRCLPFACRDPLPHVCRLDKEAVLFERPSLRASEVALIANGSYRNKSADVIRGTGYVVESLEAALWCFLQTDTFEAAVLKAANLGDDADTTAAICGQVAGAYYGESGIPGKWLNQLVMRAEIATLQTALRGRC